MKKVFSINESLRDSAIINFEWQKTHGNFLAVYGSLPKISIYDRRGEFFNSIVLNGKCEGIDWEHQGDVLAAIDNKSTSVCLWEVHMDKIYKIETGFKDTPTLVIWSKTNADLAVGTSKGNLLLYNHMTSNKSSILGKHSRKIICGTWSKEGLLIMGAEDKKITVSDEKGETLHQLNVDDAISNIQISEIKDDERSSLRENTISCILGGKTLYLLNLTDISNSTQLSFQEKYGEIIDYKWFGDGYVMLGFKNGFLVVISTHKKEIGQELHQSRDFKDNLSSIAISYNLSSAASVGDHSVKIHDLNNLKELTAIIDLEEDGDALDCRWTEDGQLLAISTASGNLYAFLTRLPMLASVSPNNNRVAYLTSLREVSVENIDCRHEFSPTPKILQIELEPKFIGVGPNHLAVGMNNQVWYYRETDKTYELVSEQEYMKSITKLQLTADYSAAWFDGKLMLQMIESTSAVEGAEKRDRKQFPEQSHSGEYITSFEMTPNFLIYSTDKGSLNIFFMEDWRYLCEFKHNCGILKLFSNEIGSTIIFMDSRSNAFLFSPLDESTVEINDFPTGTNKILWDLKFDESGLLLVCTEDRLYTYILHNFYVDAKPVQKYQMDSSKFDRGSDRTNFSVIKTDLVGFTKIPFGHKPLYLSNGDITLLNQSGKLVTNILGTHSFKIPMKKLSSLEKPELVQMFQQSLKVFQLKCAWEIAEELKEDVYWKELGDTAMKSLNIEFSIRVFRKMGNVGMVFSLLKIRAIEDYYLLGGYIALFLSDFDLAEEFFLKSSDPVAALNMRRDMLQWDTALQLAQTLAPSQIPFISREYAAQLEFTGDYVNAKLNYERGLINNDGIDQTDSTINLMEHINACTTGIARMSIRLGDTRRGISMAEQSNDKNLMKECAVILEQIKQYPEAAMLFEKAGYYDKAINVYIKLKNWQRVGELLNHTKSPKLHMLYAKAREAEGRYQDAVAAYEIAKDFNSVIRVNLEYLNNVEEAVRIVEETKSRDGAHYVAQYFIKKGSFANAIEFLVMSNCHNEAFRLAKEHGQMDTYAKIIGPDASNEDYLNIANYFEYQKNHHNAGKFYLLAGHYDKSVKHLLKVPYSENSPSVELAVRAVGKAQDQKLTQVLVQYLLGEFDGIPKDMRHLFQMYMALKQYREAGRTAVLLAREEQGAGNYRTAHDLLFSMLRQLRMAGIRPTSDMEAGLMLLHSYLIGKLHIKRGDHLKGARMLIRVAESISKFPSHIVPILTSTVVECHRAGLKEASFRYAAMLMRPEYRDQVDARYRKKMENIIRKQDRGDSEQQEEPCSECPFCGCMLPETQLQCRECMSNIPYCVATGRHIIKDDLVLCPQCEFPAIGSEFRSLISDENSVCPMCSEEVVMDKLQQIIDVTQYMESLNKGVE